jgi:phytoene dehydrogenase-like protein
VSSPPLEFDAVVIGAGHNGLILALCLQRAGLETIVLEAEAYCGGMAWSDQRLLAGFTRNPHANQLAYLDVMPVGSLTELAAHGLQTVKPDAQHGIAFSDGRPPLVIYRTGLEERTRASIASYSDKDAELFVTLQRQARAATCALNGSLFQPLEPELIERQREAFDGAFASVGLASASIGARPATIVIDELFESDELRLLCYLLAEELGAGVNAPGSTFAFFTSVLPRLGERRLPVGGMVSFAEALRRVAESEGVCVKTEAHVAEILVEGRRVIGVRSETRGEIRARTLVASATSITETYRHLLDQRLLSVQERRELAAFQATRAPALAKATFCLKEEPHYRSARSNPDVDRCAQLFIGLEDRAAVLARSHDISRGALPEPCGTVALNTLFDSSQAPSGCHVASVDVALPSRDALSPDLWTQVTDSYNPAFLSRWREFAPNLCEANVLACSFEPPLASFERRLLLRMGAAQYETSIDRLYLCGPGTYPGGGIHGACGYNAFQVIAQKFGLALSATER